MTTTDGPNILAEPYLLIERAVAKGYASITFVDDEPTAKRFYHRLRALTHGRAKDAGVWISRTDCTVRAVTDPKRMPEIKVE